MLAGLYPMTLVLQRFNTRSVLGPVVLVWAIVCAATAGVTTWQGLFIQRFFLGRFLSSHSFHGALILTVYRSNRECHPYCFYDHRK